ncbi:MAG: P-loop NTPase [Chitinivibrionales bacterium]|nr:P-loop NTPase [Chitinivibrionales bacterium]MBD3357055.1 P-loop NTPase [Chitinivibrionales bacterium]
MKIAIASGKGGTGKTTIATNLAAVAAKQNERITYFDCDVEEPNGHLFLHPRITKTETGSIPVPDIDEDTCNACGECVRFCEYRALVRLGELVMVFPELCHGCGGCTLLCPQKAIREHNKEIGVVEIGSAAGIGFVHGRLNVGEAMSPPLIRRVLAQATEHDTAIIDAPPGTSCPVIASIREVDFVALVTEPTPFGLNDLALALDMVEELAIPYGVVINRAEPGNFDAQDFCGKRGVNILGFIPDDRRIAEAYSRGEILVDAVPGLEELFAHLWETIRKRASA